MSLKKGELGGGNCSGNMYWNAEKYKGCDPGAVCGVRPGQSPHSIHGFNAMQCPGWIKMICFVIFAQPGRSKVYGIYGGQSYISWIVGPLLKKI